MENNIIKLNNGKEINLNNFVGKLKREEVSQKHSAIFDAYDIEKDGNWDEADGYFFANIILPFLANMDKNPEDISKKDVEEFISKNPQLEGVKVQDFLDFIQEMNEKVSLNTSTDFTLKYLEGYNENNRKILNEVENGGIFQQAGNFITELFKLDFNHIEDLSQNLSYTETLATELNNAKLENLEKLKEVYKQQTGKEISVEQLNEFTQITSNYTRIKALKHKSEYLRKQMDKVKRVYEQEQIAMKNPNPAAREAAMPKENWQEVFGETLKICFEGDENLKSIALNLIAPNFNINADKKEVFAILDNLTKLIENLYETSCGEKSFEEIDKEYKTSFKQLFGKEEISDEVLETYQSSASYGSYTELALLITIQLLINKGLQSTAAAATIESLSAKYGAAAVQQAIRFLSTIGTCTISAGLKAIDIATSKDGFTDEKLELYRKNTLMSTAFIFFASYVSSPIASEISNKIKMDGVVSKAFESGVKTTTKGITTTTMTGDSFVKAINDYMSSSAGITRTVLANVTGFTTEVAMLGALGTAMQENSSQNAYGDTAEMLVKLKIMHYVLNAILGHAINTGAGTNSSAKIGNPKSRELSTILEKDYLSKLEISEITTPNGQPTYTVTIKGQTIYSSKNPNELTIGLVSYISNQLSKSESMQFLENYDLMAESTTKARELMGFSSEEILTPNQINSRYKSLARQFHSDTGNGKFADLYNAKEFLLENPMPMIYNPTSVETGVKIPLQQGKMANIPTDNLPTVIPNEPIIISENNFAQQIPVQNVPPELVMPKVEIPKAETQPMQPIQTVEVKPELTYTQRKEIVLKKLAEVNPSVNTDALEINDKNIKVVEAIFNNKKFDATKLPGSIKDIEFLLSKVKDEKVCDLIVSILESMPASSFDESFMSLGFSINNLVEAAKDSPKSAEKLNEILGLIKSNPTLLTSDIFGKDAFDIVYKMIMSASHPRIKQIDALFKKMVTDPNIYDNPAVMPHMKGILSQYRQDESFAKLIDVIFSKNIFTSTEENSPVSFFLNGLTEVSSSSWLNPATEKVELEFIDKVLNNPVLTNNIAFMQMFGRMLIELDTPEKIEIANNFIDRCLSNEKLASNPSFVGRLKVMIAGAKSKEAIDKKLAFLDKICSEPKFYESENIMEMIPILLNMSADVDANMKALDKILERDLMDLVSYNNFTTLANTITDSEIEVVKKLINYFSSNKDKLQQFGHAELTDYNITLLFSNNIDTVIKLTEIIDETTIKHLLELKYDGLKSFISSSKNLSKLTAEESELLKRNLADLTHPEQKIDKLSLILAANDYVTPEQKIDLINAIKPSKVTESQIDLVNKIFLPNENIPYSTQIERFIEEFNVPKDRQEKIRKFLENNRLNEQYVMPPSAEEQIAVIDKKIASIEKNDKIPAEKKDRLLKELRKQKADIEANPKKYTEPRLKNQVIKSIELQIEAHINLPNSKIEFKNRVNALIYQMTGIKVSEDVVSKIEFDPKYIAKLLSAINAKEGDFKKEFTRLTELLNNNPNLEMVDIVKQLPESQKSEELFKKAGLDFNLWVNGHAGSKQDFTVHVEVEKSVEMFKKTLLQEFDTELAKNINPTELAKIEKILKDNNFETVSQKELSKILKLVEDEINSNDYWKSNEPNIRTFVDHIKNHRKRARKIGQLKDMDVNLTVQLWDRNNVGRNLFFGNHVGCCESVGNYNGESGVQNITNGFINGIEIVDESGNSYGNSKCFFAYVDGKITLVIDSFEANGSLAASPEITDAIISFAKRICAEQGIPEAEIMFGPNYNNVNLNDNCVKTFNHEIQVIGSSPQKAYIDALGGWKDVNITYTGRDMFETIE